MSVRPHGYAERPRQAEVGELQLPLPINQEVGGFQIPVQYPVMMTVRHAHEQLVQETFHDRQFQSYMDEEECSEGGRRWVTFSDFNRGWAIIIKKARPIKK